MMRAVLAGPDALRVWWSGGDGRLEVALGSGGYVRFGGDRWMLVAPHRAAAGPLSVLVAGLAGVRAEPGWAARVEGSTLVFGPYRVAFGGVPVARCAVPPVRPSSAVAAALASAAHDASAPPAFAGGLDALCHGHLDRATALLAGRGEGLTPYGDDVLAGYAAWMAAAGTPVPAAALAQDRSPPIALAYLRCAERGELPEPAVRLLAAVAAGDGAAVLRRARVLARWGASSGYGLIQGLAAGAEASGGARTRSARARPAARSRRSSRR